MKRFSEQLKIPWPTRTIEIVVNISRVHRTSGFWQGHIKVRDDTTKPDVGISKSNRANYRVQHRDRDIYPGPFRAEICRYISSPATQREEAEQVSVVQNDDNKNFNALAAVTNPGTSPARLPLPSVLVTYFIPSTSKKGVTGVYQAPAAILPNDIPACSSATINVTQALLDLRKLSFRLKYHYRIISKRRISFHLRNG